MTIAQSRWSSWTCFRICPRRRTRKGSRWDAETSSAWHLEAFVIYTPILEKPIQYLCQGKTYYGAMANSCCCDDHRTMLRRPSQQYALNPNRSIGCYALIKPSFCHMFRRFSVTMEPHCALKPAKHLFKNKGYYHHNANDRFGLKHG